MTCITDLPELNILSSSNWQFPTIIPGFIPLLWTTGSYEPITQDSNPWFGLVVPNRFDWHGSTAEIRFFSGGVQYNGCYVTFPPVVVKISLHCSQGFHQITTEVVAGNRIFRRNLWNIPGSWTLFNNVLKHDNSLSCSDKYLKGPILKQMDLRELIRWMELMRNNATQSSGLQPLWFARALLTMSDSGFTEACESCYFGLLPVAQSLDFRSLSNVISLLPKVTFPVKASQLPGYASDCGKAAMVIAKDFSYVNYRELNLDCVDKVLIKASGVLPFSCTAEDQDELPVDNDPRWINNPSVSCSRTFYESFAGSGDQRLRYKVGSYEGAKRFTQATGGIPYEIVPYSLYWDFRPGGNGEMTYFQSVSIRSFQIAKTYTESRRLSNGTVATFVQTHVTEYECEVQTDLNLDAQGQNAVNEANIAKLMRFGEAIAAYKADGSGCNATFSFNNGTSSPPLPRPDPLVKPKVERFNVDGKCYVQGNINIGIKFNVDFIRIFRKLGPEVQEWAIRRLIPTFIPTSIRIPFKFQLPQGQSNVGGVTVNVTGTFIQVIVAGQEILVNIGEVLAYYNLADQSGLLSFVPGGSLISDLQSFCEL